MYLLMVKQDTTYKMDSWWSSNDGTESTFKEFLAQQPFNLHFADFFVDFFLSQSWKDFSPNKRQFFKIIEFYLFWKGIKLRDNIFLTTAIFCYHSNLGTFNQDFAFKDRLLCSIMVESLKFRSAVIWGWFTKCAFDIAFEGFLGRKKN